jgi:hypothetical protein
MEPIMVIARASFTSIPARGFAALDARGLLLLLIRP